MAATYEFIIWDAQHRTIVQRVPRISTADWVLNENAPGAATFVLPPYLPPSAYDEGMQIEVWRSIDGAPAYLEGASPWLVQAINWQHAGEQLITLECVDLMDLASRREVMYKQTSFNYVNVEGPADDVMKSVIDRNMAPQGVYYTTRIAVLEDWYMLNEYLTNEANTSQLPYIGPFAIAYQNIQEVLTTVQQAAWAKGVWGGWRFVQDNPNTGYARFITYKDAYGADRRAIYSADTAYVVSGRVLAPEFGNLANVVLRKDWSSAYTFVVTGGPGEGNARSIGVAGFMPPSPFGYREKFVPYTEEWNPVRLIDLARIEIKKARPRISFNANVIQTNDCKYGRDFGLGYLVTAQAGAVIKDCRVGQVHVTLSQEGGENVDAVISSDTVIEED